MEGITEEFTAAVRGFHFYKRFWAPSTGDALPCEHEANNAFDIFAIKVINPTNDVTVGHLPLEMSRITKYILDRGATVTAIITADHYRRSPLVQGGLEVPCIIRIQLPTSILNCRLMDRYDLLYRDLYREPTDDVGLGSIAVAVQPTRSEEPARKKLKKKKDATAPGPKTSAHSSVGRRKSKIQTITCWVRRNRSRKVVTARRLSSYQIIVSRKVSRKIRICMFLSLTMMMMI